MSENEFHSGTLRPVDMSKGIEETAKEICEREGWVPYTDTEGNQESHLATLEDAGYCVYVVVEGVIYQVEDDELDPYDNVYQATRMPDGTFRYVVSFYNGGCSFGEAIEEALKVAKEE